MKHQQCTLFAGVTLVMALAAPSFAQHVGHQMPAPASAEQIVSCGQNSQTVSQLVDSSNARIEEARQANDAAAMRAVVADLQVSLARIKAQLADCLALSAGMTMSESMPGMQHAMPSPAVTPPAAKDTSAAEAAAAQTKTAGATTTQPTARIEISLVSQPNPAKVGENQFEVTVKGSDGKPVANADVSLLFVMPAVPQMKMPEMRNEVKLKPAGAGKYTGSGQVMMAGNWNVTVSVKQNGKEIGQKKVTLAAK